MPDVVTQADLDECEERLAVELGRAAMPPALWGSLMQEGLVLAAIQNAYAPAEWRRLVKMAREFSREAREEATGTNLPPAGRDRTQPEAVRVDLDDYTRRRAEVFSEAVGVLANMWATVRRFRDIHLGGVENRLTDTGAAAWLFGGEAPATAQEDMHEISRRLARVYRWRTREANWFLLTGYVPFVHPINVSYRLGQHHDVPSYLNKSYMVSGYDFDVETAEIVITAEPWVDAGIVSQAFKDIQRQIRGGDNRKTTTKVLKAVRFVTQRLKQGHPRWSALQAEWKTVHPDMSYSSRDGLSKAFRRFICPGYKSPEFVGYERTPAQRWQEEYRRQRGTAAAEILRKRNSTYNTG